MPRICEMSECPKPAHSNSDYCLTHAKERKLYKLARQMNKTIAETDQGANVQVRTIPKALGKPGKELPGGRRIPELDCEYRQRCAFAIRSTTVVTCDIGVRARRREFDKWQHLPWNSC